MASALSHGDALQTIDETISEYKESISELKERISQLKKKIKEHEAAILTLNTQRNTHCAVSKLPTELIADIFLRAKNYAPAKSDHYRRDQNRNWLNVSGVCRQWRTIILNTPQLWCSIDLSWEVQRALEFLKRSKSTPFQVRSKPHYDAACFAPVARLVMSHIERVQDLDITVTNRISLLQFLELNPGGSASALEVLKLQTVSTPMITLSKDVLWHDMPALRILDLSNIRLLPLLPMLPRLTRLVLHAQVLSASWLIQSLSHTPSVEQIVVSKLASDFTTEMATSPPVWLPKLTSLRVTTSHLSASKVFDYIDYPDSAIIRFVCRSDAMSDRSPDFSSLQRVCSQYAAGSRAASIEQAKIHVSNGFQVQLSDNASPPHLAIFLPEPSPHSISQYVQLCSMLPLARAHTLSLMGFDHEAIVEWLTLFPLCRQLTTLCLTNCGTSIFVGLLATGGTSKPPLEKLDTVVMKSCEFNRSSAEATLISLLKERKELGIAIRRVQVEECNVTKRIIEEFERHVEVYWDGRRGSRGG